MTANANTTKWVPRTRALGVKRKELEVDHTSPSSAEIENACSYTSTPQYVFIAWCLVKHKDNFTSTKALQCSGVSPIILMSFHCTNTWHQLVLKPSHPLLEPVQFPDQK